MFRQCFDIRQVGFEFQQNVQIEVIQNLKCFKPKDDVFNRNVRFSLRFLDWNNIAKVSDLRFEILGPEARLFARGGCFVCFGLLR